MYSRIKRLLVYEMKRDDLLALISTLTGTQDDIDSLGNFLLGLREDLSNEAPWKVSSIKSRLEKMDNYEELMKSILMLVEQYAREISSELGRLPEF
jgi:hypothetical protein